MVSVLVPAYNAENTIQRCMDSILGQTCTDIEVIAIDDGSQDATLSKIQFYSRRDGRVKVIKQTNQGVAAARNTALENADGDYILYVDADDWLEPQMVESMLELAGDADIVFCGNDNADAPAQAVHVSKAAIETWNQQRQLLEFMKHQRMTGMLWNKLLRKDATRGCRFNEKTGYGEDAEFLWKVLKNSKRMVVTNEILYHHTMEETSISHRSFSDKKYSAIPMWEAINAEVEQSYPELVPLARERLMCATVFSMFEANHCNYKNKENIQHMKAIVKKYINIFLKSKNVSAKFKLYAIAIWLGAK